MTLTFETPAWRHKRLVEERQKLEYANASVGSFSGSVTAEARLRALETDVCALDGIAQGEARNIKKRELLNIYMTDIEIYFAGGHIYQNPILSRCMMWAFDIGDMALFDRLSEACIIQGQTLPIKRDVFAFVADSILSFSQAQRKFGLSPEPYFSVSREKVLNWVIPDVLKAKYCKFSAELAVDANNPIAACDWYERAMHYHPDIQVTTAYVKVKKEKEKFENKEANEVCVPV